MSYCKTIKKLSKFIFSCEEYSKTHNTLTFCGIKLRTLKKDIKQQKNNNPFHYYKKNNIDITSLPHAAGKLRDLQLANLAILKQFDAFCTENKLTYFLFAGSALGQVRHKGFIPWDDDIDVAMPREDYVQIIKKFNKSNNPLLYAELFTTKDESASIIKIKAKKSDKFFIDIFAFDFTGKNYSEKEQLAYTNEIKKNRTKLKKIQIPQLHIPMLSLKNKYIDDTKNKEGNDILLGVEWNHSEPNWFLKYETVYPIKEVMFENHKFKSMANPEKYLADYYGDYMAYPKKLPKGHSMYDDFDETDLQIMNQLRGELQ